MNQHLLTYLNELGILPSMFLLRWIRLLLSREVSIEAVFFLWDRLFIWTEPALPLLDYIAASLLLTLRDSIYACQGIQDALTLLQEGRRNISVKFVWKVSQLLWKVVQWIVVKSRHMKLQKKRKRSQYGCWIGYWNMQKRSLPDQKTKDRRTILFMMEPQRSCQSTLGNDIISIAMIFVPNKQSILDF